MRRLCVILAAVLLLGWAGCRETPAPRQGEAPAPRPSGPAKIQVPGCENVWALQGGLISGGEPRGEAAYRALAALGVKTILSVDGARPDAEAARKFGIRYVHLPIGYDGIKRDRGLEIARVARDLPRPLYVHCHHGKHRGPAAAATALVALGEATCDEAASWMKKAGTSQDYWGLYADVKAFRATAQEIDAADGSFPEANVVAGLTKAMTEIDLRWENLALAREAGWAAPPDHPDIDPAHEVLQVRELFRELARDQAVQKRPEDFRVLLSEAEQSAADLETTVRSRDQAGADAARTRLDDTCKRCHQAYRNSPSGR